MERLKEYCIMHRDFPDEPHRLSDSLGDCREWISGWLDDGGSRDTFYIAIRTTTPWEKYEI